VYNHSKPLFRNVAQREGDTSGTSLTTLRLTTDPIDHVEIDYVANNHVDIDHVAIDHDPN